MKNVVIKQLIIPEYYYLVLAVTFIWLIRVNFTLI